MVYYNMYTETREFKETTEEEYNFIWGEYALMKSFIDLTWEAGTEAYNIAIKGLYNIVDSEIGYIPVMLNNDNEVTEILETVNKIINNIK